MTKIFLVSLKIEAKAKKISLNTKIDCTTTVNVKMCVCIKNIVIKLPHSLAPNVVWLHTRRIKRNRAISKRKKNANRSERIREKEMVNGYCYPVGCECAVNAR